MSLLKSYDDEITFEILYRQYVNLMLYTANGILHNPSDAEDAVQQAFLRIAKHFELVEKSICPKTANQFVIIVRNISIDIYRKKRRDCTEVLTDELFGSEIPSQCCSELESAMSQLSQQQRDMLYLYHIYGLNVKEISKLLGITKAAVYKRIERSAVRLREILGEEAK